MSYSKYKNSTINPKLKIKKQQLINEKWTKEQGKNRPDRMAQILYCLEFMHYSPETVEPQLTSVKASLIHFLTFYRCPLQNNITKFIVHWKTWPTKSNLGRFTVEEEGLKKFPHILKDGNLLDG